MKSSNRDKAEGTWHIVKGKIKEVTGKAVGRGDLESEGKAEQLHGNVQETIGGIKNIVGK